MHQLAPGTRVGAWRVKAWQGQGAYGAVYRAERVGWKRSEPGALKVSLLRWNWRSGQQVCRVLAQLARALEAVHAAGAVHRDVKGDNVLVQLLDRRAVLVDFGSCHFPGARRLTWQSLPPVTLEYLSPQAVLFYIRLYHHPDSYYPPSPADDLFALGVTAYRLVTGQYLQLSAEECTANGYLAFKGKCFGPSQPPPKKPQPTSSPPEPR